MADLFKENKYIYPLSSRVCAMALFYWCSMWMQGLVIGYKPFEHPAIVDVIRQRLFDDPRSSIIEEFPEYFTDGELAPSLVAFAATTVSLIVGDEYVSWVSRCTQQSRSGALDDGSVKTFKHPCTPTFTSATWLY